jgi:6-phosphogluconolactonase
MKENIETISPAIFAPNVADELVAAINESIAESGWCNLVVSGGKTPGAIYRLLSRPPRATDINWSKVRIFWGDERLVPHDHHSSNYKLLQETLFADVKIPAENIFAVNTALGSTSAAADAYEKTISSVLKLSAGQVPVFDVVLLGVGEDGHIASIFPGSKNIAEKNKIALPAEAAVEPKLRVTLSAPALFQAKRVYFLVKGEGKADIIHQIFHGNQTVDQLPAMLYKQASGRLTWFIDSEAAVKI